MVRDVLFDSVKVEVWFIEPFSITHQICGCIFFAGMDPHNERKMFQQLVRAASQPNTPQ